MSLARALIIGLSITAGVVTIPLVAPGSTAQAADEKAGKEEKVGQKVGKPLQEAQASMQKKQWDAALAKIKEAQAVEKKTPFEEYKINEFLASVLLNQKKYGDAANTFENILNSGFLPAAEVDESVKRLALLNFQVQRYGKSVDYMKRYLQNHPNDVEMQTLLGQAYFVQKDYKSAITATQGAVATVEKSGKKPDENSLQLILRSNYELKDDPGVQAGLEKLVRYYPKPDYWRSLLASVQRNQQSERQSLETYRLMLETGILDQPSQYLEMAQLAMSQGLPGEAQKVMEKGYANGAFGAKAPAATDPKPAAPTGAGQNGGDQARYERTLTGAKKLAEADKAGLPKLEKEAEASSSGQADVALGIAYLSYEQYDQAIAALERGINKKTGVKDPDDAQINLGIAYLRKGDHDKARAAFKAVKTEGPWMQIAKLWSIRTGG